MTTIHIVIFAVSFVVLAFTTWLDVSKTIAGVVTGRPELTPAGKPDGNTDHWGEANTAINWLAKHMSMLKAILVYNISTGVLTLVAVAISPYLCPPALIYSYMHYSGYRTWKALGF